jgi:ubiquinone/menaquinone biosynthesis C-methylase UbiE
VTRAQRFARLVTDVVVRAPFLWPLFRRPLTRLFDAIAPQWDAFASAERLTAFEAALDAIPDPPERVVDLGTGTGDAALAIVRRWPDADVLGLDVSPEMVAEARRKAGDRVRFEVADARRLPVPDASFDLVAMNNMIPFFDELARVVAPGGQLVMAFSRGPETPIFVAPERIRRELGRRGFELECELAAGPGTAIVARRAAPN